MELKGEIIYHKRNQEILKDTDERMKVLELIAGKEEIAHFTSGADKSGYFVNYVYVITGGLVIISKWQPHSGYSWSEEIITFIPIPQ